MLYFSSLSLENIDPFYPAAYGGFFDAAAWFPEYYTEKTDYCLAHPQVSGIFHYHSASVCLVDPSLANTYGGYSGDVKTYMQDTWR